MLLLLLQRPNRARRFKQGSSAKEDRHRPPVTLCWSPPRRDGLIIFSFAPFIYLFGHRLGPVLRACLPLSPLGARKERHLEWPGCTFLRRQTNGKQRHGWHGAAERSVVQRRSAAISGSFLVCIQIGGFLKPVSAALCVKAVREVCSLSLAKMKCSQQCDSFHGPGRTPGARGRKINLTASYF